MTEAVIFDLDGVIVNTVPLHFKAWKKMFGEYGVNFTFSDYKKKVDGIPRIEGASSILTELTPDELEKAASRKQNYFLEYIEKEGVDVYSDTLSLINKLRKKAIPIAVISSSKNCLNILKKTDIYPKVNTVVDGNRELRGKPAPDIFLAAASELETAPEKCVVFEDAVLGVRAAKKAQIYVIGIDRYNNPNRLKEADKIISKTSEIDFKTLLSLR